MSRLKKFFVLFLLFFYTGISLITPHIAKAQESFWYKRNFDEWFEIVFDQANPEEIYGERYTYAQVEWVIYSLFAFILDSLGDENLLSCVLKNSENIGECKKEFCIALNNVGFLGDKASWPADFACKAFITSADLPQEQNYAVVTQITSKPISGISYVKERLTSLKIIPEVKAQGFGFSSIEPIREVWKVVRNTTYFLLVFVMVVMAFMIMFRMKTSPQTIITIQSAIPKLISALILITFSYAIAGFMIDLMYIIIGIMSAVLTSGNPPLSGYSAIDIFHIFTTINALSLIAFYNLIFFLVSFITLKGNLVGGYFLGGLTTILWYLIVIIMAIVLIIAMFKILFVLIKNFVFILLTIIIGPIQILLGTIGGGGGFGGWIRKLFSYLMVYPVVAFLFFLAFFFLRASLPDTIAPLESIIDFVFPFQIPNIIGPSTWSPPFTGIIVTGQNNLIWLFASVVVITLIPKAADIVQSFFQGRPFAYGSAIGEGLAPFAAGYAMARGIPGAAVGAYGAYGTGKMQAGGLPAPFANIPALARRWEKLEGDQREGVKSLWNFIFRPKR